MWRVIMYCLGDTFIRIITLKNRGGVRTVFCLFVTDGLFQTAQE